MRQCDTDSLEQHTSGFEFKAFSSLRPVKKVSLANYFILN